MAQKYQKGQIVKQGEGFTATVVGYCHNNYVIVDDTRYSTMSMYTEGEVEEVYGATEQAAPAPRSIIKVQKLVQDTATAAPAWVDTEYKTLAEARRANPNEYPSWFRRKPLDLSGGPDWSRWNDQPEIIKGEK